jgi:HlyD family secretion protein
MQVAANIDEADIGQIRVNQFVEFTVDAFPESKFSGVVSEIRLQSTTTSNVVTYTVIIRAANPDFKLMPGMTATVNIIIAKAENALVIPLKATRFQPDPGMLARYNGPGQPNVAKPDLPKQANPSFAQVWIKSGKTLTARQVVLGINNGILTEVIQGLAENQEVVISMTESTAGKDNSQAKSPFMPTPPKDKPKK